MKSQYKTEIFYNYIIIGILLILTLSFLLPFIVVLSTSLISEAEWAARGGHVLYPKKISFVILRKLEMTFYWWGIKVTKNPFTVILASIMITGVVGFGLLRFRFVLGKCFGVCIE